MMDLHVPIIGILRGVESTFFKQLMPAAFDAGLQAIEVTMDTVGGLAMIRENRDLVPEGKYLGMGTIRNVEEARLALDAGAMFLVTPNFNIEVIEFATARNIAVISGALTPTEIYAAHSAGAVMIKVFPCSAMGGPIYIKQLRGPFSDIPLVAVGGVTTDNITDYLAAGASGLGVSTALFGHDALAEKDINKLTANVKKFIEYCR
ncbi:MAG: bifunctional 4-hydroxy-2-oxoglutarate aldolase/2-dehydro-3-deoxy-phosphogluconate aldolase [Desulfobulbaceae bacterium]|nr:bifunctional 4-hydroxy-2-oxoglutarate aldolase/2-dehydro-3-deoxy-phosphogluconate aldolase [Desulfobulbaceae bacterium]